VEKLFIIGNEKINYSKNLNFSANLDFKTIVEGLKSFFDVTLVARKSYKEEVFLVNHHKIILSDNIISYLLNVILILKKFKNSKYFIVSITPYTFFAYVILFFFTNKIYIYLRSDGFKEYETILGKKWVFLNVKKFKNYIMYKSTFKRSRFFFSETFRVRRKVVCE
jgi:hypothetical protein